LRTHRDDGEFYPPPEKPLENSADEDGRPQEDGVLTAVQAVGRRRVRDASAVRPLQKRKPPLAAASGGGPNRVLLKPSGAPEGSPGPALEPSSASHGSSVRAIGPGANTSASRAEAGDWLRLPLAELEEQAPARAILAS